MADDPSIDEILSSLDHLLKEGTGRNDDYSDDIQDETDAAEQQPESQENEAQAPEHLAVEASGDIAETDESSASDAEEMAGFEHSAMDMDDVPHPRRMLLSESMLVNNPQESLPFDSNTTVEREGSAVDDDSEGVETVPAQTRVLDDVNIEELVGHVSDAIGRQLHARLGEVLPGMVTDAVRQYMERLKSEDKKT